MMLTEKTGNSASPADMPPAADDQLEMRKDERTISACRLRVLL